MATQINSIQWSKTLPLDRAKSPVFERFLSQNSFANYVNVDDDGNNNNNKRSSLIYSAKLRENLEQQRKAFLNLFNDNDDDIDIDIAINDRILAAETATKTTPITIAAKVDDGPNKENNVQRESKKLPTPTTKKISFKIKKTASIYNKRQAPKLRTANNVQQLTNKFNNLLLANGEHRRPSVLDKPQIAKFVRQVTGCDGEKTDNKVTRRASVSRSSDDQARASKKLSVKRKASVKKMTKRDCQSDGKTCVRAKISYLECPQSVNNNLERNRHHRHHLDRDQSESIDAEIHVPNAMPSGTVRAAIAIFEKRTQTDNKETTATTPLTTVKQKPQVPAKNFSQQQRAMLLKNAERKAKLLERAKQSDDDARIDNNDKTETDLVQIINIPLTPPRRCESNYETVRRIAASTSNKDNNTRISDNQSKTNDYQTNADDTQSNTNRLQSVAIAVDETERSNDAYKPNSSFLWREKPTSRESSSTQHESDCNETDRHRSPPFEVADDFHEETVQTDDDWEALYDRVDATIDQPVSEENIKPEIKVVPPANVAKEPVANVLPLPPKKAALKRKLSLPKDGADGRQAADRDDNYEEVGAIDGATDDDGYERCKTPTNCESVVDDDDEENIYETLPVASMAMATTRALSSITVRPLPRPPSSRDSYCTVKNGDNDEEDEDSAAYETIYISGNSIAKDGNDGNYETIYAYNKNCWSTASNRDSIVSSEQQTNSLYGRSITSWADDAAAGGGGGGGSNVGTGGNQHHYYSGKATSDLSTSDKSDDWIDISDNEDGNKVNSTGFVVVRERHKQIRKPPGWSRQVREQWNKSPRKFVYDQDDDLGHHYETLYHPEEEDACDSPDEDVEEDFDSFDNDSDCDEGDAKRNGVRNGQLPDPPGNQTYVLTSIAELAGKQMRKLRRNWSLTKNDITKSLSRITKKKSRTDLITPVPPRDDNNQAAPPPLRPTSLAVNVARLHETSHDSPSSLTVTPTNGCYQGAQFGDHQHQQQESATIGTNKTATMTRKGFLNKFRRSVSISADSPDQNKTQSTFYVTNNQRQQQQQQQAIVNIDDGGNNNNNVKEKAKGSPKIYKKTAIVRPQNPPPPAPQTIEILRKDKATSWYAECGLFKNSELSRANRPNSYWYAEVGLYRTNGSTPSTSSAENSGTNTTDLKVVTTRAIENGSDTNNGAEDDAYYNMKNDHYGDQRRMHTSGGGSLSSTETKMIDHRSSIYYGSNDMHTRLEEEPLYQFYDAARVDSIYDEESSEFDSDGYEEVGNNRNSSIISNRPSAMELISPKNDAHHQHHHQHSRTLWSEIPEVINSAVLSTLSVQQKKLQEAKFEMLTSEASYLKSLNLLNNYFVKKLNACDQLMYHEKDVLFGKIHLVKTCSEKLLQDLENCWQDNILLHGVCDIVRRHAEDNFDTYIRYCENQILIEGTFRSLKDKPTFNEYLKQLENSSSCQSLTLHSFLMIPMQRITRWPLLVDAVLKRLSPQDSEYISCQYALATLNKVVQQCNEAARQMERKVEMEKLQTQIVFGKTVKPIKLLKDCRWLIRSGQVNQMLNRGDDVKLTFGKRFTKVPLTLFLFNDILLICKCKCDDQYVVVHHCPRSMIEVSTDGVFSLSAKDVQNRNMLFLTVLENQEQKTIELLLSCNSESDRERWLEALRPPQSDNPDETLYEKWDCPQVTAVHDYTASQPDELPLNRGDIINVTRKMKDGWYHGERIRDGLTGWFPANYTAEVVNPHLRARNLKQRYRLLAFSENYLKSK